ncbi:MAG TPA: nucleotide exchange factor GrpE [Verrucomicrobiae bacterium]|nr:nucleotide exchange factor GrpE [Verrucomicrobiae bacterium]
MSAKDKHTKRGSEPTPAAEDSERPDTAKAQPEVVDSISTEELAALKAKAATADENWDKFLRAAADLENYRKRVAREKEELARFTSERVVAALLPVLDNLERAVDAAQKHGVDNSSLLDGITQVYSQFRRSLVEFGLQEVTANAGHPFDPNLHEAVSQIESGEHPEGHVVEQLQRGYKLADRLLRPARVIVSKGSPSAAEVDAATKHTAKAGSDPKKPA